MSRIVLSWGALCLVGAWLMGCDRQTEAPVTQPSDPSETIPVDPIDGSDSGDLTDDTDDMDGGSVDGRDYRLSDTPCGPTQDGQVVESLTDGTWLSTGLCMITGERDYDALNLLTGYGAPNWDYENTDGPGRGIYGWSYYLRAFDLIRDTPVKEIGWGQWSKPAVPTEAISVCGLHPHGFVCDDEAPDLSGELAGCGAVDWVTMEGCNVWCCGEDDKCGVRGSIEGGMGYWMYTLETPHVKWMAPGATNANYEIFGGTFLNDRPQPCTVLGGAVRIANNLLMPNDFVGFDGEDVDGFMGYMLSRTPVGKRSATDNANYWTIA
ncbi:MAG: hypothetical protein VX210_06725, partial [Myxococcota bacterium]|nr:hypothetical protein [Myxococcota bacterium]